VVWARSGNPGRDPLAERRDDFYETPPEATLALLKHEVLPCAIWEPACGSGSIVKVLRARSYQVMATDLVGLGCPDSRSGVDFLMEMNPPMGCECIVTNPPYKLANEFIRHAIALVPKVCMLLRFAYLEGITRSDILDNGLARVYLFSKRLPRMHRVGWTGKKASSMMAFAWFCWVRGHTDPIALHRITWEEYDG
jgi:hypothetical protein